MASIADITGSSAAGSITGALTSKNLGKEDFLKLLVSQLQNQDPLNPSDPTEFTAQLAQFSSLEQQFTTNAYLKQMATPSADTERISALGMIGKAVSVQSETLKVGANGANLGYQLDDPAASVRIQILDQSDRVVALLQGSGLEQGNHYLSWDGAGLNGQPLAPGNYKMSMEALDGDKKSVKGSTLVVGRVMGVDLDSSGSVLVTGSGNYSLKDVVSVNEI